MAEIVLTTEQRNILLEAIAQYGADKQIGMAVEECAELIAAISHFNRGRCGIVLLAGEIADVLITVFQLAEIVGMDEVQMRVNHKLARLAGKLAVHSREKA